MTVTLIHGCSLSGWVPKADIVITDMPYGTTNCRWDTEIILSAFWDVANKSCGGKVVAFGQTPFDKALGSSNIKNLRYEWIWEKSHATGHLNSKKLPMKAHENIMVFGAVPYYPQMTHGHKRKTATKRGDVTEVYGEQVIEPLQYDSTSRYPRSVLRFPSDKQKIKLHPTQKPLALMEYLIASHTKEGDTVMDMFMGSGTTGLACKNLGRNFIGIEKELKYFEIAKERLK